jgi:hypothetical protein
VAKRAGPCWARRCVAPPHPPGVLRTHGDLSPKYGGEVGVIEHSAKLNGSASVFPPLPHTWGRGRVSRQRDSGEGVAKSCRLGSRAVGEFRAAPRTESNENRRCASVVDHQTVLAESRRVAHKAVGALPAIRVDVAHPLDLLPHVVTTELHDELPNPAHFPTPRPISLPSHGFFHRNTRPPSTASWYFPSFTAAWPLTSTHFTPAAYWCGFSNVAVSRKVSGSNTTTSA